MYECALTLLSSSQAVILIVIPRMRGASSLNTKNLLKFVVFFQYIPRVFRIYPLYKEVTRTSGILTETAWAGAAFNLFLYMLASHVSSVRKFLCSQILFFFTCLPIMQVLSQNSFLSLFSFVLVK